jgi:uncharacterized protein (DUF983 family)
MPDAFFTLADRVSEAVRFDSNGDEGPQHVELPGSVWAAAVRGALNQCPRCGSPKLFRSFLKPILGCPACGQDWSHQQADDFPAYVSIFLTGHILAPLIIAMVNDTHLSVGALVAIIMPLAIFMMIALLQPAKGAIIAIQWWFGMHGFNRERRDAHDEDE